MDFTAQEGQRDKRLAEGNYARISEHDSRSARVLDSELCFAVLASDTANGSGQMVALKRFHVLDFK